MEKYPEKRGYATGKLQKFLAEEGLTYNFSNACRNHRINKGNNCIPLELMGNSTWDNINVKFQGYLNGNK